MIKNTVCVESAIPEVSFSRNIAETDLEVLDLENLRSRAMSLTPPPNSLHRLSFNMLILVEEGRGHHRIDFESFPYKNNSVILLRSGQVHAFDISKNLTGKAILFTESFADFLAANMRIPILFNGSVFGGFSPCIDIGAAQIDRSVCRIVEEIGVESSRDNTDSTILAALFGALLMMLGREVGGFTGRLGRSDLERYTRFLQLIAEDFARTRDASAYANKLNISYKTLNKLCKKASSRTAKEQIDRYVILEAKRRLLIDRQGVSSIAFDLGFSEPSNFTKYFKNYTGEPPKKFKS